MAERSQRQEREADTESFVRRKKLRKGTQSCIECRRRKIRCTWPSGDSTTCSPCAARGSRCRSQQDRVIPLSKVENLTLRDRVARLESMLDTVMQVLPNSAVQHSKPIGFSGSDSDTEDITESWGEVDDRAPFVSVLDNAELLSPRGASKDNSSKTPNSTSSMTLGSSLNIASPAKFRDVDQIERHGQKSRKVCERLRSTLPKYDETKSTLETNGSWWSHFYRKSHPFGGIGELSLPAYAAQLYTSTDPLDLAILVTAYARSSNKDRHLYPLVERLVLSEPAWLQTIHGLECLLLLAKVYTDAGQPRRSWCLFRQGLNMAQLMGLYRYQQQDPKSYMIWTALYLGDRFASLLLGLPYGVNDAHFVQPVVANTGEGDFLPHQFTHRCATIAGKIMDRNLAGGTALYAKTVELNEQLCTTAASMPPEWWEVPSIISGSESEVDQTRTRLQQHFFFFQIKKYLHLPFLITPSTSDPYHHSKLICIEAARQMLKRFLALWTIVNGEKLYECKTADFMGFMAAAVMLVGLSKLEAGPNLTLSDEDSRLIASAKSLFQENEKKGCGLSSQCHKALMLLSSKDDRTATSTSEPIKIPIPYFGVVVRRHANQNSATLSSNHHSQPSRVSSSTTVTTQVAVTPSDNANQLDLDNAYPFSYPAIDSSYSMPDDMSWEIDDFGTLAGVDSTTWLNYGTVDIDQDWSMFLNDNMP
ncbi:hypothetical protein BDZ45DRAFT_476265 [Acephala macrosclerotiorum]|nr:hypothetical protein BDZ45DRAFT_476265 [Acephala macrosclerotiorum]